MIACQLQQALCGSGLETGQCAGDRVAVRWRQANTNVGNVQLVAASLSFSVFWAGLALVSGT
jgi:hypothetical protein